jgi:hypothetical protein
VAPNRMPRRRQQSRQIDKVLSEGVYTTTDPMGKVNVMRQYQAAGLIPTRFNSPNEVSDAVAEALATGKTKEQALKSLKIKLPLAFFDNKGSLIGRKFRDAQSPALVEAWNKGTKGLPAQDLAKVERSEWSNAQNVLREVGRRLGMKLDIGHFETSASGAPGNVAAAGGENSKANQAAGRSQENPFRPQTQYETKNIGFATNKVQGLAEADLLTQDLPTRGGLVGMPLNPYVSVLVGTNLDGNSSRLLPKTNLEEFNYAFEQLVKQKANPVAMFDYVMERAGQGIDINEMAKAGQNQYDVSRFAPGIEAPNAGPVRQIQAPTSKGPTVTTKGVPKGLMPTKVASNPLMRGAKAVSRAIPGPADALIPGVIGGGLALAGGATLPQAAEAFGSGVAEGLTGDIDAGPLANNQAYVVNGQQRFINQRNELVDQPGYGLQQRNGNWEAVKRGTGAAAQQERQDNQQMMQQARNLIPKVNRAMNPVADKITNEAKYFIINPLQKAFKNVFGNREI